MQTYKAWGDSPGGFYASFVLTFEVQLPTGFSYPLPRLPTEHSLPAPPAFPIHLPQAAGERAPGGSSVPAWWSYCSPAPHPCQLHPQAPPPAWVSKQLEELTSQHGGAGLAQGAAEIHVKAGRRSEARMEMFAHGNASNSSLMTLLLLGWKGSERLTNEHNSLLKASRAQDGRVSDKNHPGSQQCDRACRFRLRIIILMELPVCCAKASCTKPASLKKEAS